MVRRAVLVVATVLLVGGTSAYPKTASAPVVHSPGVALAAEGDRSNDLPDQARLPFLGQALVPRVILGADTTNKVVALTFDLDMNPAMAAAARAGTVWINQDALSVLEAQNVHATVFMTGMWAELYPALARQLAGNPNLEIANHSYSHPAFHSPCYRLRWADRTAQALEIELSQAAIQSATGITPRYFRFPGGCYDKQALDLVHAAGLTPTGWTVNSIDAFNSYPQQIASTVLSEVRPGSIVVMHLQGGPNAPSTGQALRLIIPELQQRGYQLVTLTELLENGPALQPTDPREVVEHYEPPQLWCGWVRGSRGSVYVCR